jgi:hypothetical protein
MRSDQMEDRQREENEPESAEGVGMGCVDAE